MNNPDIVKIMAKSKVKLSAVVVLVLVLMGAVTEYSRTNKPLAQAVVVLLPQVSSVAEVVETSAEVEEVAEEVVLPVVAGVRAEALVQQLQDIHEKAMAVQKPESALGNIVLAAPEEEVSQPEVLVNERVIEVYDEAGEPVEVIEVSGETAANGGEVVLEDLTTEQVSSEVEVVNLVPTDVEEKVAQEEVVSVVETERNETAMEVEDTAEEEITVDESVEAVMESVDTERDVSESVENSEENSSTVVVDEEEMPEVDMMKEIIAREQEAVEKN